MASPPPGVNINDNTPEAAAFRRFLADHNNQQRQMQLEEGRNREAQMRQQDAQMRQQMQQEEARLQQESARMRQEEMEMARFREPSPPPSPQPRPANPFMNARSSAGGANPFMRQVPTANIGPQRSTFGAPAPRPAPMMMPTPMTPREMTPATPREPTPRQEPMPMGPNPNDMTSRLLALRNGSMSGPLGAVGPGPTTGPQPMSISPEQRAQGELALAQLRGPLPLPTSSVNITTEQDIMGGRNRQNMGSNPLAGGMRGLAAAMGRPAAFKKGGAVKAAPVKKKAGGVIAKPKAYQAGGSVKSPVAGARKPNPYAVDAMPINRVPGGRPMPASRKPAVSGGGRPMPTTPRMKKGGVVKKKAGGPVKKATGGMVRKGCK